MSRKGKSHEINDILDTAFTETDYSHGNGYYDEIRDYQRPRNTNVFRNLSQTQKVAPTTTADTKSDKNMFLKYSQNDTTVKNNDTPIDKQIVVDDDNFPSLGGAKPKTFTSVQQSNKCLNFKKVVTTCTTMPTDVTNTNTNTNINTKESGSSLNTHYNKSTRYMMYHNIKDNSEKIARYRMENEYSSDDDY
jgi:hypothetical protein